MEKYLPIFSAATNIAECKLSYFSFELEDSHGQTPSNHLGVTLPHLNLKSLSVTQRSSKRDNSSALLLQLFTFPALQELCIPCSAPQGPELCALFTRSSPPLVDLDLFTGDSL